MVAVRIVKFDSISIFLAIPDLNSYMSYKCVHILYRTGIDILVSLSWALSAIPFSSNTCESHTPAAIKHSSEKRNDS